MVSNSFIRSKLEYLKTNKATDIDGIIAKLLKMAAPIICKPFTHLLNLSIQSGEYPKMLKKAKVIPIFKKATSLTLTTTVLSQSFLFILSIFERHISNCVTKFMDTHNLIYHNQSGFRKNHSCQTALTKFVNHWLEQINENNTVGVVLLDLTKAFHLVSHKILLQKLRSYKFDNQSLAWFNSYLGDRTQQVHISGKLSTERDIKAGVPHGSVLGPLLFILLINYLPLHIDFCALDLYADDATMTASSSSLSTL